jgi:hypothetical protein
MNYQMFNNFIYPAIAIGGILSILWVAFRSGIPQMQEKTITALKDRLDAQDREIMALKAQNALQGHLIDTITSALKRKGMVITIDGDMVTFQTRDGTQSTVKARPITGKTRAVRAPRTPSHPPSDAATQNEEREKDNA